MSRSTVATLIILMTVAVAGRFGKAGDGSVMPPTEAWPKAELVVKGATGGMLEKTGKLWAWSLPEKSPVTPSKEDVIRAHRSAEPVLVGGARLVLPHEGKTFWSLGDGEKHWLVDGEGVEVLSSSSTGKPTSPAFGMSNGWLVFPTEQGFNAFKDGHWHSILISFAHHNYKPRFQCIRDQKGDCYFFTPNRGCLWKLKFPNKAGEPLNAATALSVLPVLDADSLPLGSVALHPDGTPEKPALIAGGILIEGKALDAPEPVREEELRKIAQRLFSENYAEREEAEKSLRGDGADGLWRYSRVLLEIDPGKLDQPQRLKVRDLIADRISRAEPGRAWDYSERLVKLGVLAPNRVSPDYKALWIALEETGQWDRLTRVGFERARRELRLEFQRILDRTHEKNRLPFPVGGRIDHEYACEEYFETPDAEEEPDPPIRVTPLPANYWEEPEKKALWLAMGARGLWRVTQDVKEARCIVADGAGRLHTTEILGRDNKGRLLVVANRAEEEPRAGAEGDRPKKPSGEFGIWALSEPGKGNE